MLFEYCYAVSMGTVSNFPNGLPGGGSQDSEEFAEALWDSVPTAVQKRFGNAKDIDNFLDQVQQALESTGLSTTKMSIGIDPENQEAVLSISATFM